MESFEIENNDTRNNRLLGRSIPNERVNSLSFLFGKNIVPFGCLGSIFALWLLLLTSDGKSNNSELIEGACQGIYNNLAHPPFIDMLIATSCPEGYDALSLGNWRGQNILCSNSEINTSATLPCWPIYIDPEPLIYSKWKGSYICAKPVSEIMYSPDLDACPSGHIMCHNKTICVSGDVCPITRIELSLNPLENTTTTGSVVTPFGNYLNYHKEEDKPPIGGLLLSLGQNTPCLDTNEYPLLKNSSSNKHPLSEHLEGCRKYGEYPGHQLVDVDAAQQAFATQPWSRRMFQLPEINEMLAGQNAYLSYVPRLELRDDFNCKSVNLESLVSMSKKLNTPIPSITINALLLFVSFIGMTVLAVKNLNSTGHTQKIILLAGCIVIGILASISWNNISSNLADIRAFATEVKVLSKYKCFLDLKPQRAIADVLAEFVLREGTCSKWFFMMVNCLFWSFAIVIGFCFNF